MASISAVWRNQGPGHVTRMIDRFAKEAEAAVIQGSAIPPLPPSKTAQGQSLQETLGLQIDLRI